MQSEKVSTPPMTSPTDDPSSASIEQLQRMASVGAVASSVAHEFNNILTTILNHAKLGLRSHNIEQAHKSLDRILQSAGRAARVTTGMLALSRNRSASRQRVNAVDLVEEVLAVVEKDLSSHQVRVERSYQDDCWVEVVPAQIEQVVMNLLINARQAMPKGGRLYLSVEHNLETNQVEIGIRDSGSGISPEQLNRIFEPFFSTKQGPDQTGKGGTGLGLSICREIIARHQGRIRVESLVGHGSTFLIKLPYTSAQTNGSRAA